MENNVLIDREKESEWLESAYKEKKAQLLIVYGRRRIGKSFLLTHFIKKKPSLYYLCSEENQREQIMQLSKSLGEALKDTSLVLNPFFRWEDLFLYIYERFKNERFVLVIDEFPYLVNSNPAIPSIFQKYWDLYLNKTKIFLVLSGSSIGIMESAGITYKSPLYGRRTGQWRMLPLKFRDIAKFLNINIEELIRLYSITGGVPFYFLELDKEESILANIEKNILKKGSVLYDEGEILLKSELKYFPTYFSILKTLAKGEARQVNIADKVSIKPTSLPKYLSYLIKLGFIEKKVIITEKEKSKKVRYAIKDNFINFWFKFVEPARKSVEEDNQKEIEKLLDSFENYVSKRFEDLIRREILKEINQELNIFDFEKIGNQWGKFKGEKGKNTYEIDIVALNEKTREILFGECKWKDKVDAEKIIKELNEKTKHVQWNTSRRKEHFAIFARSFKKRVKEFQGKKVYCLDLKDIERILKKHS